MNGPVVKTHAPPCELVDIEHLDAMSVVLAARDAATIAACSTDEQREQWVNRFTALMDELRVAIVCMRKKPSPPIGDDIPPFLQPGASEPSPCELRSVYLKPAAEALTHE